MFSRLSSVMRLTTSLCVILSVLFQCEISVASQESVNTNDTSNTLVQNERHSLVDLFKEMVAMDDGTGSSCISDISEIIKGFHQKNIWALKIVDSSGRFGTPNFILGYNKWLGSKINCDAAHINPELAFSENSKRLHRILKSLSSIPVQYKVFILNFTSEYQLEGELNFQPLIHLGLCIPSTCSDSLMKTSLETYFSRHAVIMDTISINDAQVLYTKDMTLSSQFFQSKAFCIFSTIVIATAVLTVFAEIYNKNQSNKSDSTTDNKPDSKSSYSGKLINCFSVTENTNAILSTSSPPNAIHCLNGLRSIACFVVTVFHVKIYAKFALDSVIETEFMKTTFLSNLLVYGVVAPDWFFVISAYLAVFNFMKNEKLQTQILGNSTKSNIWLYTKMVINRYLRLTPLLIMYILSTHLAYLYLDDVSPFDVRSNLKDYNCANTWWRNLLYIQNIGRHEDSCGTWLWYLGGDLQYFMLYTALLFAYAKYPEFVKKSYVLFTVACVAVQFSIAFMLNYSLNTDVLFATYNQIYAKPWMRISTYNAGAFLGYLAYKFHRNPHKIGIFKLGVLWSFALGFFLSPLFSDGERSHIPVWICSLIISLGKLIYGSAIGLIIWLCHTKNGGIINDFLSHKFFVHFNKLSYGIFLGHPIIIALVYGSQSLPASFNLTSWSAIGVYATVASYFVNLVYSILFELPYQKLSNYLFK